VTLLCPVCALWLSRVSMCLTLWLTVACGRQGVSCDVHMVTSVGVSLVSLLGQCECAWWLERAWHQVWVSVESFELRFADDRIDIIYRYRLSLANVRTTLDGGAKIALGLTSKKTNAQSSFSLRPTLVLPYIHTSIMPIYKARSNY
jgi:hypothetical protein